jgi:BMFP domain-containing protein YqiC
MTQAEHNQLKQVRLFPEVFAKVSEKAQEHVRTIPAEVNTALKAHYGLPLSPKRQKAK